MFTGIISALGEIREADIVAGDGRFVFTTGKLDLSGVKPGDSIAVNGACLTVTELLADGFAADLSRETLECTTLGQQAPGATINLEPALCLGDALGGHLVTGHVDGVGTVAELQPAGDSLNLSIEVPDELARFVVQKGSVCVDGTSLTVNAVSGNRFSVMIIPHTQVETIIGSYRPGTRVNIEVDMIARYLERLVQYTGPDNS